LLTAAATASVAAVVAVELRRRRRCGKRSSPAPTVAEAADWESDGASRALAEPPAVDPLEASMHPDLALEAGLRALGMLSSPARIGLEADRFRFAKLAPARHTDDEGYVDTIIVKRVSPEEEERRYFVNLAGGDDLFGGLPMPQEGEEHSRLPCGCRLRTTSSPDA